MEIILYSAIGSNSSERIEWILNYKNIPHKRVEATDLSISPNGYVPALSIDGTVICESMAIAEYLDERFPDNPLLPADVLERARVREICEYINSTVHPPQNRTILKFLRPELTESNKQELRATWVNHCLSEMKPRLWLSSSYAVGSTFSLADIFVSAMYRKGLALGMPEIANFEMYLSALQAIKGSHAMLKMKKLDIATRKKTQTGKSV